MKINSVTLQAFGPFKDRVTIDLNKFDNSLFIISGKTGSGKTTIFDAIIYAFYEKLSGTFKSIGSVRSDYADVNDHTEVIVNFEKDGETYEVTRWPDQDDYAAVRGERNKKDACVIVKKMSDNSIIQGTKKIVNGELVKIIGIPYDQFKRIVVLPQGEFLALLNSKSDEREKQLSSILRLDDYDKLVYKVGDLYKNALEKIEKYKVVYSSILDNYKLKTKEDLLIYRDKAEEWYHMVEIGYNGWNEKYSKLKTEYDTADTKNKNIVKYNGAKDALVKLEESYQNTYKELIEKVKKLKLFKDVNTLYRAMNDAGKILNDNKKLVEDNAKALVLAETEMKNVSSYEEKLESLRKELQEIEAYINAIGELNKLKDKANNSKVEYEKASKAFNEAKAKVESIDKNIDEKEQNKVELSKEVTAKLTIINSFDSANYDRIVALHEEFKQVSDNDKAIETKKQEIKDKGVTLAGLLKEVNDLYSKYNSLNEKYNLGELAKYVDLVVEGKPCPLCGSIEHPNIVKCDSSVVTKAMVEKALSEYNTKNGTYEKEKGLFEGLNTQKKELVAKYSSVDRTKFVDIEKNYQDVIKQKELVDGAQKKLGELNESSTNLENEIKKLKDSKANLNVEKLHEAYNNAKSKSESDESVYQNELKKFDKEKLDSDLNAKKNQVSLDITSYEGKITSARKNHDTCLANKNTYESNLSNSETTYSQKKEAFETELAKVGSLDEFLSAIDDINSINSYEKTIKDEYEDKKTASQAICESLKEYEGVALVDLSVKHAEVEETKKKLEESEEKKKESFAEWKKVCDDVFEYERQYNLARGDNDRYQTLKKLYELLSGKSSTCSKVSIKRYILSIILGKIIEYANVHLYGLSDHHYTLHLLEGDSSSDRGLEIEAHDLFTDEDRAVGNLSGGESFIASLSLALGMSECISSISGGIKLENIFIDEGFGTLDDKTLNTAVNALLELANNNRTIGIITHVDQVKEQVRKGIEVVKTSEGSKITDLN